MYERIPMSGRLFGKRRSQIKTINKLLQAVEQGIPDRLAEAEAAYEALSQYYYQLMSNNNADSVVKSWFNQHPLYEIKNHLITIKSNASVVNESTSQNDITPLKVTLLQRINRSKSLQQLYRFFDSPDSFRSIMEAVLREEMKTPFSVTSLGGQNNRVLKVTVQDESFVCRLFNVLKSEHEQGLTAKQARAALQDVAYVVQPFKLKKLNHTGDDWVFLEFSKYFPQGGLHTYFDQLHQQEPDIEELQGQVWHYTKQLVDFYQALSDRHIWYTDLKPANLLIDENGDMRISDAKGFIYSENRKIPVKHTNTTQAYISSSVFDDHHQIDLLSVARKNLAVTLYQLLTNELPEMKQKSSSTSFEWRLKFDFDKAVFANEVGHFFKDLIQNLYLRRIHSFEQCMDLVEEFESIQMSCSSELSSLSIFV